ncbi:MAG: hypothetical protein V1802_03120 [Candidatus Aenigmatarchaeota archaeon]
METSQKEIVFARLGNKGYMAGVDLHTIVSYAGDVYPELQRDKIVQIPERSLPDDYRWSVKYVKKSSDWKGMGTFLLIKDFEMYEHPFREAFSVCTSD